MIQNFKKILIVGSAGYVGSNLINYYSANPKLKIYGISRENNKNKGLAKNFIGDINDRSFLKTIIDRFDVIINCAAKTEHFGDKVDFYKNNVAMPINLLKIFDGKYKVFIHISSEAVYLDGKLPLLREKMKLPTKTISEYSWSKNLAEKAIQKFKSKYNNKIIIIRPRLIWGGKNAVSLKKLDSALKKKIFFYVDHGKYLTSSTHIYNLYRGINKAIRYGKNKDKYFIVDKQPVRFNLLMNAIYGKKVQAFSINRSLIYMLCISGDLISWLSFGKIRFALSRSLYFLTFSEVIIDDSYTKKLLHFLPLSLEQLIREH
jgi:nucleoside-diphosphate-sugar epimerase